INETTLLKDASGNSYTEAQFDSLLPMLYYRQLAREGNQPDSLHGVEITQRIISIQNFYYRYRPADKNMPVIPLYTLFESMPKRGDLEMPGDMFRLSHHLAFLVPETNSINSQKSIRFDEQLKRQGFEGPPCIVAGNPTTRKSYDEGYFITDRNKRLFHLKMVNNRPYVGRIELPEGITPIWISVTEYPAKNFYGFLLTEEGRLFTLQTDGYEVKEVPMPDFNPETDNLLIMGNLFHWNVQVTNTDGQSTYAVKADNFELVDKINFEAPQESNELYNYLFPFSLTFTSATDMYIFPRLEFHGFRYLILSFFLLLGYVITHHRQKKKACLYSAVLIALTGIFGLLTNLIVGDTHTI
ncbi:MAG: DUF4857 domain-containing protein, partial [Bacteroidales bacterium]|nr:DUF4857 domain-containing protein [Bacteroidales bacterium]